MKPKVLSDPEFAGNAPRWHGPIRSVGSLMIAVAVIGLMLGVVTIRLERPVAVASNATPLLAPIALVQGPGNAIRARVVPPHDRFVIVAPPEIDPGMVVRAPDIDAGMVYHPGAGARSPSRRPWSPSSDPAHPLTP